MLNRILSYYINAFCVLRFTSIFSISVHNFHFKIIHLIILKMTLSQNSYLTNADDCLSSVKISTF